MRKKKTKDFELPPLPPLPDRECRNCQGTFTPHDPRMIFCCDRCAAQWHYRKDRMKKRMAEIERRNLALAAAQAEG